MSFEMSVSFVLSCLICLEKPTPTPSPHPQTRRHSEISPPHPRPESLTSASFGSHTAPRNTAGWSCSRIHHRNPLQAMAHAPQSARN